MSAWVLFVAVAVVAVVLPMVASVRRFMPPAGVLWLVALPWATGLFRAWRIASTHVALSENPSYDPLGGRWLDALGAMIQEGRGGLLATAAVAGIVAIAHVGISQRPGEGGARGWAGFAWVVSLLQSLEVDDAPLW